MDNIKKTFGIYVITRIESGKQYVGSTLKSFYHRWYYGHIKTLNNGKSHCKYLQNAWNKYGELSFAFEILEVHEIKNKELITDAENFYISLLKPEYNMCPIAGSRRGYIVSQETRYKLSKANKGRVVSQETRKKISEAKKGYHHSEETKQKIREKRARQVMIPYTEERKNKLKKARIGYHPSEATKIKMSEAKKGKKQSKELIEKRAEKIKGHPCWNKSLDKSCCLLSPNNEIIYFESQSAASRFIGVASTNICMLINKKIKSVKGWRCPEENL